MKIIQLIIMLLNNALFFISLYFIQALSLSTKRGNTFSRVEDLSSSLFNKVVIFF